MAVRSPLYSVIEPFGRARVARAFIELVLTLVPYLALNALCLWSAATGHAWWALALSAPAAGFLLRVFVIFHDCTHGSFFPSRRANRLTGYMTGLLTVTPFEQWQRSHAEHHATAGDLDHRGTGDVWTLTVDEYLAAPVWRRAFYRVFRNPFVLFGLSPALLFLVRHRVCAAHASRAERFSVYFTNAGLAAMLLVAHVTIGLPIFLTTELPIVALTATVGVWLFYVQHQFEDAYWVRKDDWEPIKAALEGSSYYKLPAVLQWLTGNIGLHHIHHVQPKIPLYNLLRCQATVPAFQAVQPLTVRESLSSLHLRLVDEPARRMVSWSDVRARRASRSRGATHGGRVALLRPQSDRTQQPLGDEYGTDLRS